MKGSVFKRGYAAALAFVLFFMAFGSYMSVTKKVYGDVAFGTNGLYYSEELVALWDQLAAEEGMDLERTDFVGQMTRTYPKGGGNEYKQQTSDSPSGEWEEYEYHNMYCIAHSKELAENPNAKAEFTGIWYIKKTPYTLQNMPEFVLSHTSDPYRQRLNFLIMSYAANYKGKNVGVNSDPVIGTGSYCLCQALCSLAEITKFTGDWNHDWKMYQQHMAQVASYYNPSLMGSRQVYEDIYAEMEETFQHVWNTAKVAADAKECSDEGYIYFPTVAMEEDGMYHVRYKVAPETREFFGAAAITTYGDWNYEMTEGGIDFKSPTGQMPDDNPIGAIDLENANGIMKKTIGMESVRELHTPVKVNNRWSLNFAQGNLLANLKDGIRIFVGPPPETLPPPPVKDNPYSVERFLHSEEWQADYVVNLRKLDAETGKPLKGSWFDVLEAFDDSQLEGSVLEDDNWDNDGGSQFLRWDGWDSPYEDCGTDPCEKDQEVTDEDGWLVEASSFGAGQLFPSEVRAHRDTKYYSYTKGYCGGHPEPEKEEEEKEGEEGGDEEQEEYERQIEICESLAAAGGFYHSLDGGAIDLLTADRDQHYEEFISLVYDYSARELSARNGYILHNQERLHEPFDNRFDGIHPDTVPVETVSVHSSQYYALREGKGYKAEKSTTQIKPVKESFPATKSNGTPAGTVQLPDDDVNLDEILILDEEAFWEEEDFHKAIEASSSNALPVLPGQVRTAKEAGAFFKTGKGSKKDAGDIHVFDPEEWRESLVDAVPLLDPDYSGKNGADWTFEIYDHRTEGEVHINKRDLLLKQGESENYDSYGDTQGDGTLEGAVYGLFAASDFWHPDGKTGVVFEKGNLVAMAATDKNGDASFLAITEAPGTVYDYSQGQTIKTGFSGPENLYVESVEKYTSNPDNNGKKRWSYLVTDNQTINGNCWIGRPLFLGSYYIQELTRSEGYELSVYGVEAEVSNRVSQEAGENVQAKGTVQVEEIKGDVRETEDGRKEVVTEVSFSSSGVDYGYDIWVKNVDSACLPTFWMTTKGKKEIYREWKEEETYYEPVKAAAGTLVVIGKKNVEAKEGEEIQLPNGETVTVAHIKTVAVTPEHIVRTGLKGYIRTLDKQYIPQLTGILGGDEEGFVNWCNGEMEAIGLKEVGKEAPYFLIDLGNNSSLWGQKLYDFMSKEDCPAFNGARLETIIRQNGKTYGVLRYSFLAGEEVLPVVFSATDQVFYVKYPISYWDGTEGYVYGRYPLSGLTDKDYETGNYLYRWIRVPNEKPGKETVDAYEDLSVLPYKDAQEYKSFWAYGEGDLLRADDGSIYQKAYTRFVDRSGYETVETVDYSPLEAFYNSDTKVWKILVKPELILEDGKLQMTIRYGDRFGGQYGGISVTATPAMNLTGTYVKPVILPYPGQDMIYEDGGTREIPVEVCQRGIVQKIQVCKEIDKTSYDLDSYGKVHKDWFTRLFGGYSEDGQKRDGVGKMDNFRFKVYLKSNLTRLYRWEDGQVIWQDRKGQDMGQMEVLEAKRIYPKEVPKIYTKVLHQTEPLYQDSRDGIIANEILYGSTNGVIHEEPNKGYTAVLETIETLPTGKVYNYTKFFDAIAVANHDKWEDAAPSYTSWQPIGNQSNRREETLENARVSDQVRQFAIDWYLEEEVKKWLVPVNGNNGEMEAAEKKVDYPDEILDRALREAIKKAENYLIPFFAYDLDEIYQIHWDWETGGGMDQDTSTLSADLLFDEIQEGGVRQSGYCGTSVYLPYGTYVVTEQQPQYAGFEYGKNLQDFKNKHYKTDLPKEVILPSIQTDLKEKYYYNSSLSQAEMERKYHIRFNPEDHVIYAHNYEGDFEIYKYGMDIGAVSNGVPKTPGKGDYFTLTQNPYKPYQNAYNENDNRMTETVDYYLTEGQSGRNGIGQIYRYSSLSEQKKANHKMLSVHGVETAYDGRYAPMLVPWSVTTMGKRGKSEEEDFLKTGSKEREFGGFAKAIFTNRFYGARLRLEKLDSETHENILHDGALFAIYAAEREDSLDGNGQVRFYKKDTRITGTKGFLESMGAVDLQPVPRGTSFFHRLLGKEYGPGALYTGVVASGTPVCKEEERIVLEDHQGNQTGVFYSYSTVLDGKMKDEENNKDLSWQLQTVGYLETPKPLGAGSYVICEEKAPAGYVRSKPMALEIYSDKVTYYKEGKKDNRVMAALYEEIFLEEGKGPSWDLTHVARVNVENTPIKLKVEKWKEASEKTANTTPNKTVTYRVSGRVDGKLAEIGNHPDYVYAYEHGQYLGYAWKKGTLEYLAARKAAGESVEIVFEGSVFAGYGYVTRSLETATDRNPYVAGGQMTLVDALVLNPSGDIGDHAFEGLVMERNGTNNIIRMYVKEGYGGEKKVLENEKDGWSAVTRQRPDTDILYYDLDSLEVTSLDRIDGREILYGYGRDHKKVPVAMVQSDKANFHRSDTEESLFAFKGGTAYLEFVGGDFTKLQYFSKDKRLKVSKDTLVYHLDRDGNRDSLVNPDTGMAYVPVPGDSTGKVMVWPVKQYKDLYGNIIARDKITTWRPATVGENQEGYNEQGVLDVINHSGKDLDEKDLPSYQHTESGFITGTWYPEEREQSHIEKTIRQTQSGKNLNGEMFLDENNGSFSGELNPVYNFYGLPEYYQKSKETYRKGIRLYDRNNDFVRYKDSDHLMKYNNNAYHINTLNQLYDGQEQVEMQRQKKLYHRQGEGYILENTWMTSDSSPNDPFHTEKTVGQPDILKRVPAGNYIMEELVSPKGYLKGFPTGILVQETPQMHYSSMVDKTTKIEISKIDGAGSRRMQIWKINPDGSVGQKGKMTEPDGSYGYQMVPGAELALFEAKKVYTPTAEKGYYLEKISDQPFEYESTDSQAKDVIKKIARWTTGTTPIYVEGIPEGTYILEELAAPEGFAVSEPVEVEITNQPNVQIISMYNDHTKVEMEKYAMEGTKKKPLAGAKFALYEAMVDSEGNVQFHEGKPMYYLQKRTDEWMSSDLEEYSGFMPAFEAMYREFGTEKGTMVSWMEGDQQHTARYESSGSIDASISGGHKSLHPTVADMIFSMEDGVKIRVIVYGNNSFSYQFDYRALPWVNPYACSYFTLDGVRRMDYLPVGMSYVLVETEAPMGYAKGEDRVIQVMDTPNVQRHSIENTEGKLYISKTAVSQKGELVGAHLGLYQAGPEGEFIQEERYLKADWFTGQDGVYTQQDFARGQILQGYKVGDVKPHEVRKLESGIYWLAELESPDYYTAFKPVKIEYEQNEEIRLVRVQNVPVTGSLTVQKNSPHGKLLKGAVFEVTAYKKQDMRNPVFTKRIADQEGVIQLDGLLVGEVKEDGSIEPYLYKMREILPPDGYEVNTRIFTWEFKPDKEGVSYRFEETAEEQFMVVDQPTRVSIGKKDFYNLAGVGGEGFLSGAEFAVYEIKGRGEDGQLIYEEESPKFVWVSKKGEEHKLEGLIGGHSYLLKELSAPDGYGIMEPILFTLSRDGRRIVNVSNCLNTITVHSFLPENPDFISAVTIQGRYPVQVKYELSDDNGKLAASWVGSRDGYLLQSRTGLEEGKICTITERTLYSDGSCPISGQVTMALHFDTQGHCKISGREAEKAELVLEYADGGKVDSFLVQEGFSEKMVENRKISLNDDMLFQKGLSYQLTERTGYSDGTWRESSRLAFTLGERTSISHITALDQKSKVSLSKREITGSKEIPGCQMRVKDLDNREIASWISGEEPYMLEGVLTPGESYYLEEVNPANGFAVAEEIKFTVLENGVVKQVIMKDEETKIKVNKWAFYPKEQPVAGAILQILYPDHTPVKAVRDQEPFVKGEPLIFCSGTEPVEIFGQLCAGESYLLHEVKPAAGYGFADDVPFTVSRDGKEKVIVMEDLPTRVVFRKKEITGEQELPGNRLRVKDEKGREVVSWVSGKEPYELVGVLEAGKTYQLEEVQPRDGYAWAEEVSFTVSLNGAMDLVVMKNDHTRATICKIDGDLKKPLAGAILQMEDEEGKILEQWISGEESHEITGKLTAGKIYYLCEVKAPEGYQQADRIKFQMPKKAETLELIVKNVKKKRSNTPKEPEIPQIPHEPETPKEPGRITAIYWPKVPKASFEQTDRPRRRVPHLPQTGDRSYGEWYRILLFLSFFGICLTFFGIFMTKERRFAIMEKVRKIFRRFFRKR